MASTTDLGSLIVTLQANVTNYKANLDAAVDSTRNAMQRLIAQLRAKYQEEKTLLDQTQAMYNAYTKQSMNMKLASAGMETKKQELADKQRLAVRLASAALEGKNQEAMQAYLRQLRTNSLKLEEQERAKAAQAVAAREAQRQLLIANSLKLQEQQRQKEARAAERLENYKQGLVKNSLKLQEAERIKQEKADARRQELLTRAIEKQHRDRLKAQQAATEKAEREAARLAANVQDMAMQAAAYLQQALTAFAEFSLDAFRKFNQAMTESLAILFPTQEETKKLTELALELGGKTIQGPIELAKAYFYMASAGYKAEEIITLLPVVTNFATAGMMDMASATTLLADAHAALKMNVGSAEEQFISLTRVSDVLTKANILSNATIKQLSQALTNKAAATGKSVGYSVESITSVLAIFAQQGLKSQEAGSRYDQMLRYMQNSALKAGKAQKQLGFEMYTSAGEMKEVHDIVADLERIMEGMSDQTKSAMLKVMGFDARFQAAILPLLGTSKKMKEVWEKLHQASGITDEVARRQLESFNAQLKILWNQITVVAIRIGELIGTALTPLIRICQGVIGVFDTLGGETKTWVLIIGTSIGVVIAASIAYGVLSLAVAKTGLSFAGLAGAIIRTNLALLASPVGVIAITVAAVAGLVLWLTNARQAWDELTAAQARNAALGNALATSYSKQTEKIIERARDINKTDKDEAKKFIDKEMERAQKERDSINKRIEAAQKYFDDIWAGRRNPQADEVFMRREQMNSDRNLAKSFQDRVAALKALKEEMEAMPRQMQVKLNLEVIDFTDSLEKQAAMFGHTSKEAKLYELSLKGATEAQLANAKGLLNMIEALEENKKLEKEASEIKEKYRTKEQKYRDEVAKINLLFSLNKLTNEEHATALKMLEDEYNKVGKEAKKAREEIQKFDAVLFGSAEAATRLAQYEDMMRIGMGDSLGPVRGATVWGGKVRDEKRIAQERKVAMSEVFQGQFDDPRFLTELKKIREGTDKLKDTKAVRLEAVDLA